MDRRRAGGAGQGDAGADAGPQPAGRSGARGARVRRQLRTQTAPPQRGAAPARHARRTDRARRPSTRSSGCATKRWARTIIRACATISPRRPTCATRSDPIARAANESEVPLPTALALMLREALTGQPIPPAAARRGRTGARIDRSAHRRRFRTACRPCSTTRRPSSSSASTCCATSRWSPAKNSTMRATRTWRATRKTAARIRTATTTKIRAATSARSRRPASRARARRTARSETVAAGTGHGRGRSRRRGRGRHVAGPPQPRRGPNLPETFDYKVFTEEFDEVVEAHRAVRFRGARPAARLSRQPADRVAGRRHPARQPAAAAADGAAEPQLGLRPGRRPARCRPARPRGRQPRPFAELQDRARAGVQGHRRHPADRQFGLDARAADLASPRSAPTSWRARSNAAG